MIAERIRIVRYELTMNGTNTVGLIQGGYGLGILNDDELKDRLLDDVTLVPIR
ncbi:hypothetical protein P4H32_26410 [Bacillus cereus]|nr:hypothetical protein [Bacillus cereus]